MFIEFQVGNFRSFRDIQKFSMQAAPLRANDGGLEEGNVFQRDNLRGLKTKAIYGSNASGKSNFVAAFEAFSSMVSFSVISEGLCEKIWNDRFKLLLDWEDQPIFFQYTSDQDNIIYRYGFEIQKNRVINEWLFGNFRGIETEYFLRTNEHLNVNKEFFSNANFYIEQARSGSNELYRIDSLFLTAIALNANKLAKSIRDKISEIGIFDGSEDDKIFQRTSTLFEIGTPAEQKTIMLLLKAADTGIVDIKWVDDDGNQLGKISSVKKKKLLSVHNVYDENGNLIDKISVPFFQWESGGTQKFLAVAYSILLALNSGNTFIIDEFDARFHPNLTLKIVELFQSKETNPKNSQLIFITHDSGLLRKAKLRRDQICFVNKDQYGISSLTTLIEYKGVRKDASYEKEYLQGSYAGVPYLDELDSVITQTLHDNGVSETK